MQTPPIHDNTHLDPVTAAVVALENYADRRYDHTELVVRLRTILASVHDSGTAQVFAKEISEARDAHSWVENHGWDVLYHTGCGPDRTSMVEAATWAVRNTPFAVDVLHAAFTATARHRGSVKIGTPNGEDYLRACAEIVTRPEVLTEALRRIHHYGIDTRVVVLRRYLDLRGDTVISQVLQVESANHLDVYSVENEHVMVRSRHGAYRVDLV